MSSEGSVTPTSSRIRQFGLYRTIDARTNEFLKSSRKRQIRQGCACAAISTAITVTVVVSVILVYEYSINSETNLNKKVSLRSKWLGLMNESDPTKIDSKFTKKINFDRTTLKLLPVLLKALNKNRYLEKIIEEYASSSPSYERTDETDNYFKRNIFANTKNWLKMPSSKTNSLDYKTTPLIYIKPQSERLDYLSRIRKIRNYERMLNYFDRMINGKVTYPKQNQKLKTDLKMTESPLKIDINVRGLNKTKMFYKIHNNATIKKHNATKKVTKTTTSKPPTKMTKHCEVNSSNKEIRDCQCPNNMGQLLNKLILSIQELVPHIRPNQIVDKKLCPIKMKPESQIKKVTAQSTLATTETVLSEWLIESGKTKPMTLKYITESTVGKTPSKLITSTVPSVIRKQKTIRTTTSPLYFIKRYMAQDITTTKAILCPKSAVTTESHTSSNMSTTTPKSNTEELILHVKAKKPTTTTLTVTTEQPQTISGSNFTAASATADKQNLYINDIESSTVTTPTTITEEEQTDIEDSTLRSHTSTVDSTLNYGYYQTKSSNEEIVSHNTIQQTTPFNIAENIPRQTTTELIVPFKFNDPLRDGSSENMLDSRAIVPNFKRPIIPLFREDEYDDYFISSTPKDTKDFDNFDLNNLESIKNKVMSSKASKIENIKLKNSMHKGGLKSKTSNYHPVIKNQNKDLISVKKKANLVYLPNPIDEENGNNTLTKKGMYTVILKKMTKSILSAEIDVKSSTATPGSDHNTSENVGEEEFQEEWIKQPENIELPIAFNKSDFNFDDDEKTGTAQYDADKTKTEDKSNSGSINSMLPPIRPIYLEVRRNNEWKPEDHADYDINLANNIFDLPNI